jgi:hypothetical protein
MCVIFNCGFLLKVCRIKKMLTLGEIAVENIHLFRTRGFFFNLFVFSEPKLKLLLKLITKQLISLCYSKKFFKYSLVLKLKNLLINKAKRA